MELTPVRIRHAAGLAVCLGSLAFAIVYLEGMLGLAPCPLCVLDRILFWILAGIFALAALRNPQRAERIGYDALGGAVALVGIAVTVRHIQLQAAPAPGLGDCGAGFWDLFEAIGFEGAVAAALQGSSGDCGAIQYTTLGLTLPQQTFGLFLFLFALVLVDVIQALRRRP